MKEQTVSQTQAQARYQEAVARAEQIEQEQAYMTRYGTDAEVTVLTHQLRYANKAVKAAREDYWASIR